MDKAQVKILIMVLIGVMYFGQALYAHFKKQARQQAHRPKPQPRMRQSAPQPVSKPKPATYSKPAAKPQLFLAGETLCDRLPAGDEMTENSQISPPDSTIDDSTSPIMSQSIADNPREELRKAVIWSEILKRKY